MLIDDGSKPISDDIQYTDSRPFCDIRQEYPEAAFNTLKVGLMMGNLLDKVGLTDLYGNRFRVYRHYHNIF